MRYTVWSHGQEIGETDLGFRRFLPGSRSGWFHPNAAGEKLMPVIDAVSSAMLAYMHRNTRDASGQPIIHPEFPGSPAFAEAAEAFARAESLDLQLRREDGTVVPTASVGLQDCQHHLKLEDLEIIDWTPDDDELEEAELVQALDELARLEGVADADNRRETGDWSPEESAEPRAPADGVEPRKAGDSSDLERERYQIHVLLDDDGVIP